MLLSSSIVYCKISISLANAIPHCASAQVLCDWEANTLDSTKKKLVALRFVLFCDFGVLVGYFKYKLMC